MKVPKNRPFEVRHEGHWIGYFSTRERAQAKIDDWVNTNFQPGYNYRRHNFEIIDHRNRFVERGIERIMTNEKVSWGDFLDTLRESCQECGKEAQVTEELFDDEGWVEGYLFRCPNCKWEESFGIYEVLEMRSKIFHNRTFKEIQELAQSREDDANGIR